MKRLLFYSHDTYGLGNIRRILAIAEHLVEQHKNTSILILSGSPMLQAFRLRPRIDYIKLPCLIRGEDGEYGSKFLNVSHDRLVRLRADIILNTLLNFEPDLILVDKKPLGVQNELAPALQVLRRRTSRPKLVLLLREILDTPQLTQSIWEKNGYHQAIAELYDQVLVLGSQGLFDTGQEYQFPETTLKKTHYCGYLGKRQTIKPTELIRKSLELKREQLLLVTPGGGQDGFNLLNSVCLAFGAGFDTSNLHIVMCLGPELQSDNRAVITRQINELPFMTTLDFTDDMMSYMNAADVVVSMAGYNTVTELLTLGKEAVLVPRTEPVQEQWLRATRLERHHRFTTIHPDQLSPTLLRQAILSLLSNVGQNKQRTSPVELNALDKINEHFQNLFAVDQSGGWERLILSEDSGLKEIPQRSTAINFASNHRFASKS